MIESKEDINKIDPNRPVSLYSQTTKRIEDFHEIAGLVKEKVSPGVPVEIKDTICRQVSNRVPHLKKFAQQYDLVLLVAGQKSSNGNYLFTVCKEQNQNTYRISRIDDIDVNWFNGVGSVGICGATSTPNWLMNEVANWIKEKFSDT